MNIVISTRGNLQKLNVPNSSQDEPNDDNASGEGWGGEKLTDR
jgi:hypothetical protein